MNKEKIRKWVLPGIVIGLLLLGSLNLLSKSQVMGVQVVFPDGGSVLAEVADTPEEYFLGFFATGSLPENTGILFLHKESGLHAVWTKNIRSPVDILWLDPNREIIKIEKDISPCLEENCPSLKPEKAALFQLILKPGSAKQHGLEKGMALKFQRINEKD